MWNFLVLCCLSSAAFSIKVYKDIVHGEVFVEDWEPHKNLTDHIVEFAAEMAPYYFAANYDDEGEFRTEKVKDTRYEIDKVVKHHWREVTYRSVDDVKQKFHYDIIPYTKNYRLAHGDSLPPTFEDDMMNFLEELRYKYIRMFINRNATRFDTVYIPIFVEMSVIRARLTPRVLLIREFYDIMEEDTSAETTSTLEALKNAQKKIDKPQMDKVDLSIEAMTITATPIISATTIDKILTPTMVKESTTKALSPPTTTTTEETTTTTTTTTAEATTTEEATTTTKTTEEETEEPPTTEAPSSSEETTEETTTEEPVTEEAETEEPTTEEPTTDEPAVEEKIEDTITEEPATEETETEEPTTEETPVEENTEETTTEAPETADTENEEETTTEEPVTEETSISEDTVTEESGGDTVEGGHGDGSNDGEETAKNNDSDTLEEDFAEETRQVDTTYATPVIDLESPEEPLEDE